MQLYLGQIIKFHIGLIKSFNYLYQFLYLLDKLRVNAKVTPRIRLQKTHSYCTAQMHFYVTYICVEELTRLVLVPPQTYRSQVGWSAPIMKRKTKSATLRYRNGL